MYTDWTVRGSNPGGSEIFHTRSERPGAHPASYSKGTGSFLGASGWGVALITHTHVKSRLKCGSLISSSVSLWHFIGRPLPFRGLNPELNPICYLLALLRAHHFLHVSRIRVKLLTLRWLMGESNGNLPLRTCPGCSVPEPYRSPDWALVPA